MSLLQFSLNVFELFEVQLFVEFGPVGPLIEQLVSAAATPTLRPVLTTIADINGNNFLTSLLLLLKLVL